MSLLYYKILAALLIFVASIISVIYPLRVRAYPSHHHVLEIGDAVASGIFLGAALFHMLPDAINEFALLWPSLNYPLAELICSAGFLFLLFFERLSNNSHDHTSFLIAVIIIIHALIEGAALGVNTTLATASIIFVAIFAHKSSESFALAVILNRSQLLMRHIILLIAVFSLMTPLGIALGTLLAASMHHHSGLLLTATFNSFAAGTFLYISTLHHINHHQRSHEGEGMIEYVALLTGLIIMAVLALWS